MLRASLGCSQSSPSAFRRRPAHLTHRRWAALIARRITALRAEPTPPPSAPLPTTAGQTDTAAAPDSNAPSGRRTIRSRCHRAGPSQPARRQASSCRSTPAEMPHHVIEAGGDITVIVRCPRVSSLHRDLRDGADLCSARPSHWQSQVPSGPYPSVTHRESSSTVLPPVADQDTPINPGNSGGPLFTNRRINTSTVRESRGEPVEGFGCGCRRGLPRPRQRRSDPTPTPRETPTDANPDAKRRQAQLQHQAQLPRRWWCKPVVGGVRVGRLRQGRQDRRTRRGEAVWLLCQAPLSLRSAQGRTFVLVDLMLVNVGDAPIGLTDSPWYRRIGVGILPHGAEGLDRTVLGRGAEVADDYVATH